MTRYKHARNNQSAGRNVWQQNTPVHKVPSPKPQSEVPRVANVLEHALPHMLGPGRLGRERLNHLHVIAAPRASFRQDLLFVV